MNIMLTDFWNVVNSSGGAEKVLCRMANELVDREIGRASCRERV